MKRLHPVLSERGQATAVPCFAKAILNSGIALLLILLSIIVAACSPGHLGSNEIAFVRAGHLWTIDPDGANAFEVVNEETPVVGYAWSPTHQVLTFRTLDETFARTTAAQQLASNPVTGLIGDLPSGENTIGVDGGTPIPTTFSSPDILLSNAMWDTNGSRLLYRQTPAHTTTDPINATWVVAQNDQPGNIASKSLPESYTIPSLSYASSHYLALGAAARGIFTTTLAGTANQLRLPGILPGHPLPAALERVLWRPAHQDQSFLYAISTQSALTNTPDVQLVLRTLTGQTHTLASCTCTQFAWSPNGNTLFYSTSDSYTIINEQSGTRFQLHAESGSVPYWSPDSHFLLLDGPHTLQLVTIANRHSQLLLTDGHSNQPVTGSASQPGPDAQLQPVPNSLWSPDSRHFVFLTHNRLDWSGKHLNAGKGLYVATLDNNGHIQGSPTLVDRANDTQPGWSYQDPNTSFLY